ncbi:class I SAM-dependent methyltransferase [Zavarzinia sp. CC-PAN008]|uniref:class I SAM-dependent methyltransferase n=1 Tax=Zavarzinia sp. CC-PAN008 TaxID=3243332 RepID=UPI003F744F4F
MNADAGTVPPNAQPGAPCPVCGSSRVGPFAARDGFAVVRCAACGFAFVDPMPGTEVIAALYDDAYDGASSGYFAKAGAKLARARGRLRQLRRHVRSGRFLDVGANAGFMTAAAAEAGFEAVGVEPDAVSVRYARENFPKARFLQGLLGDVAADLGGPFDLVYCSEVIEHTPDPNGFVEQLRAVMKPGAVLFLTTPDLGHWRRPRDLMRWDAFCPPSHLLYFSGRNLVLLLERHGFQIVRRRLAIKPGIKLLARRG